jgi:hypothetical protein
MALLLALLEAAHLQSYDVTELMIALQKFD